MTDAYAIDSASAKIRALAAGETVVDTFSYEISDGAASSTAQLAITITGQNDAPVVQADAANVQEDVIGLAMGNVLDNDHDPDATDTLQVFNAGSLVGQFGTLSLEADGSYTYALDQQASAVQALRGGESYQEAFSYSVTDGTITEQASLLVTVLGTNDAPVGEDDFSDMQVATPNATVGNVLLNDRDIDLGTVLSVSNAGHMAGRYGVLELDANGNYRYVLDTALPEIQALPVGAELTETFTYTVQDDDASQMLASSGNLFIRIAGSNAATGRISGYVYLDAGDDGVRNSEAAIVGVTVTLSGSNDLGGLVNAQAVTNAVGYYEFADLRPGNYTVTESQPSGYADGKETAGSTGGFAGADTIAAIVLAAGEHSQENNFGELPAALSSIGDLVFLDCNNNGIQDAGEKGVSDVTVKLLNATGAVIDTTTTSASGQYLFGGLGAGNYAVQIVAPVGYGYAKRDQGANNALDSDVDTTTGKTVLVSLGAGVSDMSWDAGLVSTPVRITYSFNGNTATDGTDGNSRSYTDAATGVSVTANAWSRDKIVGTWSKAYLGAYAGGLGVTDKSEGCGCGGTHTIDNNGRDNYVVYQFSQAVTVDRAYLGYVFGDSDATVWIGRTDAPITNMSNSVLTALGFSEVNVGAGSTRWADINADQISGNVLVMAAKQGECNDFFKIGKLEVSTTVCTPKPEMKASMGSRVWCDSNGNGLQDSGELGVSGVAVNLLNGNNQLVASATTNASGDYSFTALTPGSYLVEFVKPVAYGGFTLANQGCNDALDSDADAVSGRSALTTLVAGENDVNWDAGLRPSTVTRTYRFSGKTATDGTDGNTRAGTVDGISVTASAWSRDKANGAWAKAYLGAYSRGYGVTDRSEGKGRGNTHAVDNNGCDNFVVYQFSDEVVVDKAYLGYVSGDSDISVWIGNYAGTIASMSNAVLSGLGFTEVNSGGGAARWADLNANGISGNVLVIAAKTGESNDCLKIEKLQISATSKVVTPIVIDLDGDGLKTTSWLNSTGSFDLFNTGSPIKSGWLSGDDGFLAVDKNANGKIDSLSELFGGFNQGEGFAQLAGYDSNGDGMVNVMDTGFAELRIWRDRSGDHVTDSGELMTMAQAGVENLNLGYQLAPVLDENGNLHGESSSASLSSGQLVKMTDVYFAVSPVDAANEVALPTLDELLTNGSFLSGFASSSWPGDNPAGTAASYLLGASLDGQAQMDSQVQNLVQAMASFAPSGAGLTTVSAANQSTFESLLAANLT